MAQREQKDAELSRLRSRVERLESERALFRQRTVALSRSEERLELALQAAALGLWDWNLLTDELVVNSRWSLLLGLEPSSVEPHIAAWQSRVHPDDMPRVNEALERHRDDDSEVCEVEHRLQTRWGDWKWVVARGKIVERDASGKPMRMAGTLQDITERRQSDEMRDVLIRELRRALAKVKTLSGLLPICAGCKKIRDDEGYWKQIEEYLAQATDVEFSHSLCPECLDRLYPEIEGDGAQPAAGA